MPAYEFVTADVFTNRRFGGNPLAVFPDAKGLSDAQMQAIAAEFNLSEATFVLPPEDARHDAQVRIFTPPQRDALHLFAWRGAGRLRSRMFAPLDGIAEDPATGAANAALAAPLTSLGPRMETSDSYDIEQGIELGRPSRIIATARKGTTGVVTASVAGE